MNRLFSSFIFEGTTNTRIYETYVERILVPSLKPGMVIVIDNARFHKSKKTVELIEAVGCKVLFLPPYSPDFNPIEHHWAGLKSAIRKTALNIKDFFERNEVY